MALSPSLVNYYGDIDIDESDADIVIINTIRKHDNDYVAGYAGCLVEDAHNRCILVLQHAAHLWRRNVNSPIIEKERRTALHEIMHTLGAIKLDNFRDSSLYLPAGNDTWIAEKSEELGKVSAPPPPPHPFFKSLVSLFCDKLT